MPPPVLLLEEIERRSYKEYAYSLVPKSCSLAVYETATLTKDSVALKNSIFNRSATSRHQDKKYSAAVRMAQKGSKFLQYVAAVAANLSIISTGAMLGWTSPILPRLMQKTDDSPLSEKLTTIESFWIGSSVTLSTIFGCFIVAYVIERWGRKKSLLTSAPLFIVGWILVITTNNVIQLYVARLIFGCAMSFAFTTVPIYIGEIAETSMRGTLGSYLQLSMTFGVLFSYVVGSQTTYTVFSIICACIPILFFVCFFTMPESPTYLISKGERKAAVNSLARLRSKPPASVQKEADEIQAMVEEAARSQAKITDLFTVKANFKALIYTVALVSFQQLSGITLMLFYMQTIFDAAKSSFDPAMATITVGTVQVIVSFVTPFVADRLGRRLLLVMSGIGETVTLGTLGFYFYLQDFAEIEDLNISWLPIACLIVYITSYCLGWGALPLVVMSEMFAPDVKSKASGIAVIIASVWSFLVTRFGSDITIGRHSHDIRYWFFASSCFLSILFTVFILPETKGKDLQEIQDELNGIKPATAKNAKK